MTNNIVVAVSTGVDSMVLLHQLMQSEANIIVVHINHKIRTQSELEETFIRKFCEEQGLLLEVFYYEEKSGNFQKNARDFRYKCFNKIYQKYDAKCLYTAHHGDDLVETIIMRQLRGSSLKGYAGFRSNDVVNNMNVCRLLINYSKQQIYEYATKYKLDFFEDASNNDNGYFRNNIRNNVVSRFDGDYVSKYCDYSSLLFEISDYVNSQAFKLIHFYKDVVIELNHEVILVKYALNIAFSKLYGNKVILIDSKHISLIIDGITTRKKVSLPLGYFVSFHNNYLVIYQELDEVYSYEYSNNLEVRFLDSVIKFGSGKSLNLSDEVAFPLRITNADLNLEIEMNYGSKKLNRVFIDEKVMRHKRKSWPILIDSTNKVICVFGLKHSKYCLSNVIESKNMLQYECVFGGIDYDV